MTIRIPRSLWRTAFAPLLLCLSPAAAPQENAYSVPLHAESWHSLRFSSIPANTVTHTPDGVLIRVRASASPLIHPLTDNPPVVKQISIKGTVDRLVTIAPAELQGQEGFDDFNLKLGLVFLGEQTLSWYQAAIAADWVKQMFALAPPQQGIDHIFFLNGVLSPALVGQTRVHPSTDYIKEQNAGLLNQSGDFAYTYTLPEPRATVALWLSVDGDDTGSEFDLRIDEIVIRQ